MKQDKKSATPSGTQEDRFRRTFQSIDAEHRDIEQLLDRIRQTTNLEDLVPALRELRGLLAPHFALEEEPQGFRAVVTESAPQFLHRLDLLFDEHKGFLTTLSLLIERAEVCLKGPVREIHQEAHMFVGRLRAHETQETQLFSDALYEDLGESS